MEQELEFDPKYFYQELPINPQKDYYQLAESKEGLCQCIQRFGKGYLQIKVERHKVYELSLSKPSSYLQNNSYINRMTKRALLNLCQKLHRIYSKVNPEYLPDPIFIWSEEQGSSITNFRSKQLQFDFVFVILSKDQGISQDRVEFSQILLYLLKSRYSSIQDSIISFQTIKFYQDQLCQAHHKEKNQCWECKNYKRSEKSLDVSMLQMKLFDQFKQQTRCTGNSLKFEEIGFLKHMKTKLKTKEQFLTLLNGIPRDYEESLQRIGQRLIDEYNQTKPIYNELTSRLRLKFQQRLTDYVNKVQDQLKLRLKNVELERFSYSELEWTYFEAINLENFFQPDQQDLVNTLYLHAVAQQKQLILKQVENIHQFLKQEMQNKGIMA